MGWRASEGPAFSSPFFDRRFYQKHCSILLKLRLNYRAKRIDRWGIVIDGGGPVYDSGARDGAWKRIVPLATAHRYGDLWLGSRGQH